CGAGDVDVVARFDADDADVLDRRLGAVARAAGDRELDLGGRPRAAQEALELDAQPRRILRAEAAPFAADAGLHRAQALGIGLARHHAGGIEVGPHRRQVLLAHAQEVDALAAGHLD